MSFDDIIDRHGTHSVKWDMMEKIFGVPAEDGIPMWVADMDFRAPDCIQNAVQKMRDHGIYGYYGDDASYRAAICWWMENRHGWQVQPEWIFTTHGLVNGTAMCVDTFTQPGDGVVLTTPVYHAFAKVIKANNRRVIECDLVNNDGRYEMDFEAWDAQMDGSARMFILCSPHNPGGRVWTQAELEGVADFCRRHDLILVSDEIHHDLVFPGQKHTPMALIDGIEDRLLMMSATTKTFNIAGSHSGNVIIPDEKLREKFHARMMGLGLSPNSFGLFMAEAAYSPEGAAWVDDLVAYLDGNRKLFDAGVAKIPGVKSMPLEATYLAWVDFADTGMSREDFTARVERDARIAVNYGTDFGSGGNSFLRFNLATPRPLIEQAVERLQKAFADLQ
ncbi:pyridoxal phosphate-dependent aminotransferase [Lutimaribacter sp. EGI FJ00015]|uniref:Pyridoxal phosphate-dependent aminotransferase n=1 Tax=Lutimaribacter degradans TaxID=2945989 RepID=A0ACC5ZZ23_9RHOB|nr:MalY/PatB family protein [Lutimaribacter sp. EGI FJ00013]MCM2563075.1 pyridoxal phosphate-dependent aminotransferase [Lutimaribacter sp. EGI FJ00013]MCO0614254.1 pyridoxal phosphate-dependent aminotransferase [Lutimaribacter sp. EGI FJ00015]MCO0637064.1 pyridoxal phosphate-dependent aminotransferase [Lutimaribacter sp. EGI FJ00014]